MGLGGCGAVVEECGGGCRLRSNEMALIAFVVLSSKLDSDGPTACERKLMGARTNKVDGSAIKMLLPRIRTPLPLTVNRVRKPAREESRSMA